MRIDWGYIYAAADASQSSSAIGYDTTEINTFISNGALTGSDDSGTRAVSSNQPVLAFAFDLGSVGAAGVQRHVIVALDELNAINYFGLTLKPYWTRQGTTVQTMLTRAQENYRTYAAACSSFDTQLMADMTTEGGANYAQLGALSYRQAFTACGLAADSNGQPLYFTKENSSNGDIATVDVIFPMFPQLLLFSPTLAQAALRPVLDYATSSQWTFPNSPHDLGTYPNATGRPDGGEAMPVEETANMLIMIDAIAKEQNSPAFANQYFRLLEGWATFLKPYGYATGTQLTTDDFLGTITDSTNLAVKAIVGLRAFADLAQRRGDSATANTYIGVVNADVAHWMTAAISSDGSHWLDAYGNPNSGVELYNLVYDQILGFNAFPASVAAKDIAYSKTAEKLYGVPILSFSNYTSLNWSVWDASMATSQADFNQLITPTFNYYNTTPNRLPMTDIYDSTNVSSSLFRARPVVGGTFAKMLTDPAMWNKYSSQDHTLLGTYAGFPVKKVALPSALETPQTWKYTTATPNSSWLTTGFNDSAWSSGLGGFGTAGTPGIAVNTTWNTSDIYLRKTFTMPAGNFPNLKFELYHDEDVSIYVNGVFAASETGYITNYETLAMTAAAQAQLVAGQPVTLMVQCHQIVGGQGVDVGLVSIQPGISLVPTRRAVPIGSGSVSGFSTLAIGTYAGPIFSQSSSWMKRNENAAADRDALLEI